MEQRGIEPLTSALRTRRSAKLSYCPTFTGILERRIRSVKLDCRDQAGNRFVGTKSSICHFPYLTCQIQLKSEREFFSSGEDVFIELVLFESKKRSTNYTKKLEQITFPILWIVVPCEAQPFSSCFVVFRESISFPQGKSRATTSMGEERDNEK